MTFRRSISYFISNLISNLSVKKAEKQPPYWMLFLLNVGVKGFEPSTPCSQSRCANRTALHPEKNDHFAECGCKGSKIIEH